MTARQASIGVPATSANALLNALLTGENADSGVALAVFTRLSSNIDHLVRDWNVTNDTTGIVKASILLALYSIPNIPIPRTVARGHDITMTTTHAVDGGAAAVIASSANLDAVEANENSLFFRKVVSSIPSARTWIVDLAAAYQVRKLTPKNIEGYFMSKNSTRIIGRDLLSIVEISASILPNIMSEESSRSAILNTNNNWLKYHTTACSTAALVKKCIDVLNPAFPTMFSADTLARIDVAANALWNKALPDDIPRTVVALTYVWLKEAKQLPENWYQGQKAYESTNPVILRRFASICKKYLALCSESTAVDAINNINLKKTDNFKIYNKTHF